MVTVLQVAKKKKIFLNKTSYTEIWVVWKLPVVSSDVSPHKHHYYGQFNLEKLSFQGLVEKVTNSH